MTMSKDQVKFLLTSRHFVTSGRKCVQRAFDIGAREFNDLTNANPDGFWDRMSAVPVRPVPDLAGR